MIVLVGRWLGVFIQPVILIYTPTQRSLCLFLTATKPALPGSMHSTGLIFHT